jgi:hypothetical protein
MNTATQQGAASVQPTNPDLADNEVAVKENPRQVAIDAMAERQEQARLDELNEAIAADPGLAASQAAIEKQIDEANATAREAGELPPLEDEDLDGAASREPMHEPEPESQSEPLPDNLQSDPLAEYIVMDQGQPMFQAKVNGQQKLIPLEQARRQLQIGTAAEIRMQEAAHIQAQLEERERAVAASEAALKQRVEIAQALPPVPAQSDLTEEDLLAEAKDIFNTAFTGTEDEAAEKLAKVLVKLKTSATSSIQPIDEKTIVTNAASMAVSVLEDRNKKKDVQTGYTQFKKDYPDIMADPKLYRMADNMTDEIEKENPEWDISQVMLEAGKRTRAWVNNLKGDKDTIDLELPPEDENANEQSLTSTQSRQERKTSLVRMPAAAAGAVHETPSKDADEKPQTALEAFLETKEVRGQPT